MPLAALRQVFVGRGDIQIGARQRRLEVVDERGEEIPLVVGGLRDAEAQLFDGRAQAGTGAEPGRQHVARLRPCEHPGHRAQRIEAFLARTLGRP